MFTATVDGGDLVQLTDPGDSGFDGYPRWLPDGSGIIFNRCSDLMSCQAWLIAPDGSDERLLFEAVGQQSVHFVWQPTPAGHEG